MRPKSGWVEFGPPASHQRAWFLGLCVLVGLMFALGFVRIGDNYHFNTFNALAWASSFCFAVVARRLWRAM